MTWVDAGSPDQLLQELSVRLYEPPLSAIRRAGAGAWPEPFQNIVLFLDFDTEVSMQGLLGFLENSAGQHLEATINMFRAIGARKNAETLVAVQGVMARYAIGVDDLRANIERYDGGSVASFAQVHGPEAASMAREIAPLAAHLYLNDPSGEDVYALVEIYITTHEAVVRASLRALVA